MSLLLYAIADCQPSAVGGAGLDGDPLCGVGEGGLTAVVSHGPGSRARATPHALLNYERTVERLMARHPILPARFGSVFGEEDDLRAVLRDKRGELAGAMDRVRGAVELAVTLTWREAPKIATETGTAYLLGRLELRRRAECLGDVLAPLAEQARLHRLLVLPRPPVAVSAAYLVIGDRVAHFTQRVAELTASLEDVDVACTGPWPPYSFVKGALA